MANSGGFKSNNDAVKRGVIRPKRNVTKSKTKGESRDAYMARTGSYVPF